MESKNKVNGKGRFTAKVPHHPRLKTTSVARDGVIEGNGAEERRSGKRKGANVVQGANGVETRETRETRSLQVYRGWRTRSEMEERGERRYGGGEDGGKEEVRK